MGILDLLRPGTAARSRSTRPTGGGVLFRSSFATQHPNELVWNDYFGQLSPHGSARPYSRLDALRVPAIAASRNRIVEKLAGRPLVDYLDTDERADPQPAWLSRTDDALAMSPYQRMVATLDDHIFNGVSAWAVRRGASDQITEAMHIPFDRWHQDEYGVVFFDGEEAPEDQVIVIPSAHPGLLVSGRDLIEGGLALEQAWRSRAQNPVPSIILQEREDNGMNPDEAKVYVDAVAAARSNPNGSVMFIPFKIDARFEEHSGESFLEAARNAIRLDVAAHMNLTAQSVEASKVQSTLTYETAEQAEAQTTDRMSFWSEPIEARLSLDDVVPKKQRVRFDFTNSRKSTTGTYTED
ncbi:phage portal protein [Leucobacter komagatae]|uniref:Phage portal protein n=1 Tax=Leucobacter komagatae TaxID=55969 RepID=A0A542Y7H6_9MICO|nr:phage portal protein [Leucobacter komagatae]TQL44026.1 phage portal protein [Leucobacter komagatae]